MDKALIEKAKETADCKTCINEDNCETKYCKMYNNFVLGANWQREQIIKELREWIVINRLISYDTTDTERLLAKLDLLEKGGK